MMEGILFAFFRIALVLGLPEKHPKSSEFRHPIFKISSRKKPTEATKMQCNGKCLRFLRFLFALAPNELHESRVSESRVVVDPLHACAACLPMPCHACALRCAALRCLS
jgi:hypothetical protein